MSIPTFEEYEAEVERPTGRYQRNTQLPHGYAASTVTDTPNALAAENARLRAENVRFAETINSLHAQLASQRRHTEAERKQQAKLCADLDHDLTFEYNACMLAEAAVAKLREDLAQLTAERDAAPLIEYSTGSLTTTYPAAGERLIIANALTF